MLVKALSGLKHTTFPSIKKFPQVILRRDAPFQLHVPFGDVTMESQDGSADFLMVPPTKEIEDMSPIVEIRSFDKRRLMGLGFVDARSAVVSCFHLTRPSAMLPAIDNQFFVEKISAACHRRRSVLSPETTAYRAVHGVNDLLPSLEIDHYCASFARIRCNSAVGERLVPLAAEFLQERGAEQLIIETPSIPAQRVTLITPTMSDMRAYYQEDGIQFLWEPQSEADDGSHRWQLDLAFRRARFMARNVAAGKQCLCIGDTAAGMALNVCLSADHVCIVEEHPTYRKWVRQNLTLNHGARILDSKVSLQSSLQAVVRDSPAHTPRTLFDLITLEVNRAVDDVLLKKLIRVAAPGAMLLVQMTGTNAEVAVLTVLVGNSAMEQGRSAYEINRLGHCAIDFPAHALALNNGSANTVHSTFLTFLIE